MKDKIKSNILLIITILITITNVVLQFVGSNQIKLHANIVNGLTIISLVGQQIIRILKKDKIEDNLNNTTNTNNNTTPNNQ